MKITLEFDEKKKLLDIGIGLAIILKYHPDTEISVGYKELWIGDFETTYEKMTDEEKAIMEKGDWKEDEDSWYIMI